MRTQFSRLASSPQFLLLLLSLGACKWTEFDDLRDEAWVNATSKPDGSKSSNWGVAIVRGKADSPSGGRLAVFGSASSRLNEIQYDEKGNAKQLPEQNLGNIGIANLAVEPIVLGDPHGDDFALVTQGSAQQVVVAAGGDSNLLQFIINGATSVDAATYLRAPAIDSDEVHGTRTLIQKSQPIIAASNQLFGTFFENPDTPAAFIQPKCTIVDSASGTAVNVEIRGLGAVPAGDGSDDLAVWTSTGDMLILDGHVFNGDRSGSVPASSLCPSGTLDIFTSTAVIKPAATVGLTPDKGSLAQIIAIDDRFALLQGHTNSTSFLAVWDFKDPAEPTAGKVVGSKVEEAGLRSAALYDDNGTFHVVAGYPSAIVDGVSSGKVLVYPMDTTAGINVGADETFTDSQPEDGQAYGRTVAVIQFNDQPVIAVGGNNEVFTFFRTPTLYNADRRTGR